MAAPQNAPAASYDPRQTPTLFGHPTGLYNLFFAEMWERFSFYGMRALLVLYMTKGFLGYTDKEGYTVYGAYTALVYLTPFFGGLLADRLLGHRRAVVLGGLFMAAGQALMTIQQTHFFFLALGLLICGNGFFKPNISTMVGSLYSPGSGRRDAAFTIFYMGVNLGAAIATLLCSYVGETYGLHLGFGLATFGMLIGIAVFVVPTRLAQSLILLGAVVGAYGLAFWHPDNPFVIGVNLFVALALLGSAVISVVALNRGDFPAEAGAPPNPALLRRRVLGPINLEWSIYLGALVTVLVAVLLVSGIWPLFGHMGSNGDRFYSLIPSDVVKSMESSDSASVRAMGVLLLEISRPAGVVLFLAGFAAVFYIGYEMVRLDRIARERLYVVMILTFFSLLFWTFFEQAGSSVNLFTDRNVDRVVEDRVVTEKDVGTTIEIQPTQEQLGWKNGGKMFTLNMLTELRDRKEHEENPNFTIDWKVTEDNIGMGVAERRREIPASMFQSINSVFILLLGLPVTALWTWLAARRIEPATTVKFAMGLLQLGLGFVAFWYGAQTADQRGMVFLGWLMLGYLLHTTGELCLSPVGLSMVTKLSPTHLVGTVMGIWFLATSFSQLLSAIIAQFTAVPQEGDNAKLIPPPAETVHLYGDVFGQIAIAAIVSAVICFALAPLLNRWMHPEEQGSGE